jgi:hypothetical protein
MCIIIGHQLELGKWAIREARHLYTFKSIQMLETWF